MALRENFEKTRQQSPSFRFLCSRPASYIMPCPSLRFMIFPCSQPSCGFADLICCFHFNQCLAIAQRLPCGNWLETTIWWYPERRSWILRVWILVADRREFSQLTDTIAYLGYESLLCGEKDEMELRLSAPLLEVAEASGKSRAVGRQ